MKRISHVGAALLVAALALGALPAQAQYANEFSLAKLIKKGTTTQPIAGSGTVQVKVQVNADGTHKVIGVEKSSNQGDNAAALEIAQNSTYMPAHKGKSPTVSFYTFILKFNGKSVAPDAVAASPGGNDLEGLIKAQKYQAAISKANMELLSSPGNPQTLQWLGLAQFFNGDQTSAANSFSKVPTIGKQFTQVAARSFASAAVKQAASDPALGLNYAQKAMALSPDSNSGFALAYAQLQNKQFTDAIATFKPVHDKATDTKQKLEIDQQMLAAYLGSNDSAGAAGIAAEMKQLDPNGNSAAVAIGNYYLNQGNAALNAKDFDTAFKAYTQAAAIDDPKVSVTGDQGATLAQLSMAKPDYAKAQGYATKWVTAAPDDANANFYAGIATLQIYVNTSHSDKDKTAGIAYLKKADTLAKAANNVGLSLRIETQLKAVQP